MEGWACTQAVLRFYRALDENADAAALAEWHPAGVWHRQGVALTGHAAIAEALAARPGGRAIRHLLTNLVVMPAAPGEARVTGYMTIFSHHAPPAEGPAPLEGMRAVLHCTADLTQAEGGWRLRQLSSRPLFRAA